MPRGGPSEKNENGCALETISAEIQAILQKIDLPPVKLN